MNIDLPINRQAERLLLGALLLMLPDQRDHAVGMISDVWFSDPWHRRFFEVLVRNRGRDFTAETLADAKQGDGPHDNSPWWIAQLLVDRDESTVSGNPAAWQEYAGIVERLYAARVQILVKTQELEDLAHVTRTDLAAICEPAIRDEKANAKSAGMPARIVLDGLEIG